MQDRLRVLQRLQEGLAWSLARLPKRPEKPFGDPAVAESMAAIVDRFCKLQDPLAGAMRHAHAMLGEKQRSFHDVMTWAVAESPLADEATWLERRSLRRRLTHEYDPASDTWPERIELIRSSSPILATAATRLAQLGAQRGLLPAA